MVWGTIGAAALGFLGGERRNRSQERLAGQSTEFNREQAEINRAFQERMSNTAHQRQMDDLRTAGLNPILAAKYGGASSPSGGMAQAVTPNVIDSISSGINTGLNTASTAQNIKKSEADIKQVEEQVRTLKSTQYLNESQIQVAIQQIFKIKEDVKRVKQETERVGSSTTAVDLDNRLKGILVDYYESNEAALYRSKHVNPSGKRSLVFDLRYAVDDVEVTIACGYCVGCRLERSRQWAVRCVHESQLHSENTFITLTYSPEHLPYPPSLDVTHFQKFMKRFRKKYSGTKIRFFHCGEYGEETGRPHYHAIIFGFDFPDKVFYKKSFSGFSYYNSCIADSLWGKGRVIIGDVSFESSAYVARYIMKKVNGEAAEEHYKTVDPDTGEIFDIKPEYITMSRNPGIAFGWYQKYKNDVYPSDLVVMRGKRMRPPKYYDNILEVVEKLYSLCFFDLPS